MSTSFYNDCLSPDLQDHMVSQLGKLLPEQLALNEEVAINRMRTADLVKEWSDARMMVTRLKGAGVADSDLQTAQMHLFVIGEKMAEGLKDQREMVTAATNADHRLRETLTQNTLMMLMNSVMRLVHERFNDGSPERIVEMEIFESDLRQSVVITETDNKALAVEAQFGSMLDTIPGPPGIEQ